MGRGHQPERRAGAQAEGPLPARLRPGDADPVRLLHRLFRHFGAGRGAGVQARLRAGHGGGARHHGGGLRNLLPRRRNGDLRPVPRRPVRHGGGDHHPAGGGQPADRPARSGPHRLQPTHLRPGLQLPWHDHHALCRRPADPGLGGPGRRAAGGPGRPGQGGGGDRPRLSRPGDCPDPDRRGVLGRSQATRGEWARRRSQGQPVAPEARGGSGSGCWPSFSTSGRK